MAYEAFLALSEAGGLQQVETVYVRPNTIRIIAVGDYTPQGLLAFLVDCSGEDEATAYITRLGSDSIAAMVEDPDIMKSLLPTLMSTTPSLGKVSPGDRAAHFPFRSGQGLQDLVLRHVERPMVSMQLGGLVLDTPLMN